MADFLSRLPAVFRERWLNKHETYLKSISDVVSFCILGLNIDQPNYTKLVSLIGQSKTGLSLHDEPSEEQPQFRNLRNSWYHELALRSPQDFDSRLQFSGWKIIQGYYCIYSSVSAMVRCLYPTGGLGHKKTLNLFAQELIASRRFRNSFVAPANIYLDQYGTMKNAELILWEYGRDAHLPVIEKCLNSVRGEDASRITILHYLKSLREWATYEDSYLLFRMYGESVKRKLDFSLQTLASFYLTQSEVFLIKTFGYDALFLQYASFIDELARNMNLDHSHLRQRFIVYEAMFRGTN